MKKLLISKIRFYILIIRCLHSYSVMLVKWLVNPRYKNKICRVIASSSMLNALSNNVQTIGVPDLSADVIIVNHCSMFDIVTLEALYTIDVCWIGKDELKGTFGIIGPMQYPNHITIDRSSKSSMLSLIKKAKKAHANNRPIVIFPEGTRNKKDTLLPFKNGAKVLTQVLQAKVQPIVLTGIKETVNFSKQTLNPNIPIKVQYLPTIEIKKTNKNYDTWYKELYDTMNQVFVKETEQLKKYT